MFKKEDLWASNGNAKTSSLFSEVCRPNDTPLLSLNGTSNDLPCLRDLFVPLVAQDPSEATFAEVVFNDLRYWAILREAKFIQAWLEEYRKLADIKRKQVAFKAIIDDITNPGSRTSTSSAKYILEEPWKGNSKKAVESKKKTTQEAVSVFQEDVERLREHGFMN
jgi:hypothetical protein